jgi:Regulator of chromosome condensation (RCC1) repeat
MSSKKRKTSTPEKEDFQMSPIRKVVKAQRHSLGGSKKKNFALVLLKQQLYKKGVQEIMESEAYRGLFSPSGPRLSTALKDGYPQFVNASLTDLRWALAAIKDTYQRPTGDVIAMGQEDTGQLGLVKWIGKDKDNGFPPTLLQDLRGKGIIQVACGGMHSAALTEDGTAYTWGCNDDGALGRTYPDDDEEKYSTPPTPVQKMIPSRYAVSRHVVRSHENECHDVIAIDAGASHTTFLTISGNVYVSGR